MSHILSKFRSCSVIVIVVVKTWIGTFNEFTCKLLMRWNYYLINIKLRSWIRTDLFQYNLVSMTSIFRHIYTVSSEQIIPSVVAIPSTELKHLLLPKLQLQNEPLYTWTVQLANKSSQDRKTHLLATLWIEHVPPSKCNPLQQLLEFSSLFLFDSDRLQSKIATPH